MRFKKGLNRLRCIDSNLSHEKALFMSDSMVENSQYHPKMAITVVAITQKSRRAGHPFMRWEAHPLLPPSLRRSFPRICL